MNELFAEATTKIGGKATWNKAEILTELKSLRDKLITKLNKDGKLISSTIMRFTPVAQLRKYDIVYMPTYGTAHYILVYKVKGDRIYGVSLTSKDYWSIYQILKDRIFENSYVSKSIVEYPHEEARQYFIRVYEDKKEADDIFKSLKNYYRNLFGLKI